ncbi:MAG: hypothetical protein F4Y02_10655 [Chloroflexi bacterium]|nr:hypothetical protein [Chloroflexota bacterium]
MAEQPADKPDGWWGRNREVAAIEEYIELDDADDTWCRQCGNNYRRVVRLAGPWPLEALCDVLNGYARRWGVDRSDRQIPEKDLTTGEVILKGPHTCGPCERLAGE